MKSHLIQQSILFVLSLLTPPSTFSEEHTYDDNNSLISDDNKQIIRVERQEKEAGNLSGLAVTTFSVG